VGCLEAIASGPRTVAWALDEGWRAEPASGAEAALAGAGSGDVAPGRGPAGDSAEPVADGRALAASAAAGDKIARAALARSGNAVGIAIASSAATLDLDLVTVAGGFSQSGPIFWDALRAAFDRHTGMDFARAVRVEPSSAPSDVALRGAAAFILAPDRYAWVG